MAISSETEAGLIYVLTNEAMPGLVKIGIRVGSRAQHHCPVPFTVEFADTTGVPVPSPSSSLARSQTQWLNKHSC